MHHGEVYLLDIQIKVEQFKDQFKLSVGLLGGRSVGMPVGQSICGYVG